jgi:phospholipid N-methyltransferase
MLAGLDLRGVRTIVEYGPGTGVFTRAVVDALGAAGNTRARVVAVELNVAMAERLRDEMRALGGRVEVRHDNALRTPEILRELGEERADVVVSGLGWPSLPASLRRGLIEQTAGLLAGGGSFRTFGYHVGLTMPGAWEFRRLVREKFERVRVSDVVWGNVPPAFVYECDRVPVA